LHAAWWEEGDQAPRACDEYQLTYAPSVAVLSRCLERQNRAGSEPASLLAVRNPTRHITSTSLLWAEYEVDEARRLFTADLILGHAEDSDHGSATRERLKQELPRYSVALLATHGVFDPWRPWTGSGIYTADRQAGEERTPQMTLADFYEIDLGRVQLVMLTACESAQVDLTDATGEQIGLPSALLAAGASAVVGSLWAVNDMATALLGRSFFQQLRGPVPKMTKGRALWLSQRWLRNLSQEEAARLFDEIEASLPAEQTATDALQLTGELVRSAREKVLGRGPHPFSNPAHWAALGCYGSV
jgi:CHAT domain-containing protein